MSLLLLSSFFSALYAQTEPTTQKQRADRGFFIWPTDYIIWFSVCCVHIPAHTNLVADGRSATHAHTILSLSLFCLLKHALSLCRLCAHTLLHRHSLSEDTTTPHFSRQAGPLVPGGRETEWRRKRSVDLLMCVCCLHPNSQFSPGLHLPAPAPILSCKFSSLSPILTDLQNHTQILFPSLCASFTIWLTVQPRILQSPAKSRAQTCFIYLFFYRHETKTSLMTSEQSHLLLAELYIYMSCRITCWRFKCHLKDASRHKDISPVLRKKYTLRSRPLSLVICAYVMCLVSFPSTLFLSSWFISVHHTLLFCIWLYVSILFFLLLLLFICINVCPLIPRHPQNTHAMKWLWHFEYQLLVWLYIITKTIDQKLLFFNGDQDITCINACMSGTNTKSH